MSSQESLSQILLANAPAGTSQGLQTQPWIEATLGEMLDAARSAWPNIDLDPALFVSHIASHWGSDCQCENMFAADLYLAAACLAGNHNALAKLDTMLDIAASKFLKNVQPEVADEVQQAVRIKLLIGTDEKAPGLASYAGRGPLAGWLRVVMTRHLLDMQRAKPREIPKDNVADLAEEETAAVDPEVAYLREKYRKDFKQAFAAALQQLSDREMGVLRLHVANRMSIDKIAACCGIGRSTAARWLANIREQILESTRMRLAEHLTIPQTDAKSIIRALRSDYDLSVGRLLAEHDGI